MIQSLTIPRRTTPLGKLPTARARFQSCKTVRAPVPVLAVMFLTVMFLTVMFLTVMFPNRYVSKCPSETEEKTLWSQRHAR